MISTNFNFITNKQMLKPFFYVNVTDIDSLQEKPFYAACNRISDLKKKNFMNF
jgi:hypothetical protein